MGDRGRHIFEFEASLVYRVSSSIARTTQRNFVSRTKPQKKLSYFLCVMYVYMHVYVHDKCMYAGVCGSGIYICTCAKIGAYGLYMFVCVYVFCVVCVCT